MLYRTGVSDIDEVEDTRESPARNADEPRCWCKASGGCLEHPLVATAQPLAMGPLILVTTRDHDRWSSSA